MSGHWDLALLVSALNFYAIDGSGRKVIPSDDNIGAIKTSHIIRFNKPNDNDDL